ncbi:MAG TPA: hypothetical protein VFN19_02985 [Candidatus Nanopelagicales bacterium]|jgi:hypothetical protein|nr:hypothetical protein [Candidatus Nanopelagicales bacterium]
MDLTSVVVAAGDAAEEAAEVPAWIFGAAAFVILLLLLFLVSRINIDR